MRARGPAGRLPPSVQNDARQPSKGDGSRGRDHSQDGMSTTPSGTNNDSPVAMCRMNKRTIIISLCVARQKKSGSSSSFDDTPSHNHQFSRLPSVTNQRQVCYRKSGWVEPQSISLLAGSGASTNRYYWTKTISVFLTICAYCTTALTGIGRLRAGLAGWRPGPDLFLPCHHHYHHNSSIPAVLLLREDHHKKAGGLTTMELSDAALWFVRST